MSITFFKHLFFIVVLVVVARYNYNLILTGRYEEAFRDPLWAIVICCGGIVFSLFWMCIEILKVIFAKNNKVMERLNGDFWTVLLGPVKEEK